MNYLLLSFILQIDKFRTFLCWQSKVKAGFAEQISPVSGFRRVGVHPLHWQVHVRGTHEVCHLMSGQGVAQPQACSWLHPSLHLLPPPLGLCSSENPPLPFILNCSQWRLFLSLKACCYLSFKTLTFLESPVSAVQSLISPPLGKGVCTLAILSPLCPLNLLLSDVGPCYFASISLYP